MNTEDLLPENSSDTLRRKPFLSGNQENQELDPFKNGLPDRSLTGNIINAAIVVHKTLGPGFLESMYEEALCIELGCREIVYERQKIVRVSYQGNPIGEHRLDLLVAGRIVVELKAIKDIEAIHFSVVRSYMKALNVDSGLLLNFFSMPLTIKRVGRERAVCSSFPDFQINNKTSISPDSKIVRA